MWRQFFCRHIASCGPFSGFGKDRINRMKIVVLERNSVGLDIDLSLYEKYGEVTYYPNTVKEDTAEKVKDADIIIANKAPMNEETLKEASNVKLICEFATGYDNVDLEYCKKRGIKVANVVDYSTAAVAQHTFAMALYLAEKLSYYDNYVKSGTYGVQARFFHFDLPFTELEGKTWGIIGMGNIGRKVAGIAQAFGCRVIFYSASGRSSCTDYPRVELDELLRTADLVSLHCPLTSETHHMINADTIKMMRDSAVLVNTSRGGLIDTRALIDALRARKFAGVGLDVYEDENGQVFEDFSDDVLKNEVVPILMSFPNVVVTSHQAFFTRTALQSIAIVTMENARAFARGEKLVNEVK